MALGTLPCEVSRCLLLEYRHGRELPLPQEDRDRQAAAPEASEVPPGIWPIVFGLSLYVAGEVLVSMWLVSYLRDVRGLAVEHASRWLAFFFLALSGGRALLAAGGTAGRERALCFASLGAAAGLVSLAVLGFTWALPLAAVSMSPAAGPGSMCMTPKRRTCCLKAVLNTESAIRHLPSRRLM